MEGSLEVKSPMKAIPYPRELYPEVWAPTLRKPRPSKMDPSPPIKKLNKTFLRYGENDIYCNCVPVSNIVPITAAKKSNYIFSGTVSISCGTGTVSISCGTGTHVFWWYRWNPLTLLAHDDWDQHVDPVVWWTNTYWT